MLTFKVTGVKETEKAIKEFENKIKRFRTELLKHICKEYSSLAKVFFRGAEYDGLNDVRVFYVVKDNYATIMAMGTSVLFIEFGTGLKYSAVIHPMGRNLGMFPSTWSLGPKGKKKWDKPNGWIFAMPFGGTGGTKLRYKTKTSSHNAGEIVRDKDGRQLVRTYGNKPNMIMYQVAKSIVATLPSDSAKIWRSL